MRNNRFKDKLIGIIGKIGKYRTIVMSLAVVVVFVTTYMLILPALTLEKTEAEKLGGIDIGTEASEDVSGEKSDDVTVDEDKATVEPSGKKDASDVKKTDKKAKADTAKDAPSDPLTFEGEGFSVAVEDAAGVLPKETSVVATELVEDPTEGTQAERKAAAEEYRNYYDKALEVINDEAKGKAEKSISFVKFYDITLQSGDEAIQPEKPVNVTISYDEQQQKDLEVEEKKDVRIIHFAKDEETGEINAEIIEDKNVDVTLAKSRMTDTTFEAEGFSVYGIVYTVDFHWEVDGKKLDFSIPGGGFISFSQLIEVLGIETEDTKSFVEKVKSITFSNPELLSVSKVEEDTTVGAIKDALVLECEYSAELTEEEIEEINAQTVNAGDWALISLKAFDSEEYLTVTMKSGESFRIRVTDARVGNELDGKIVVITPLGQTAYEMGASVTNGHLIAVDPSQSSDEDYWVLEYDGRYDNTYHIKSYKYNTYIHLDNNNRMSLAPNVNDSATLFWIDFNTNNNNEYMIYTKNPAVYINFYERNGTRYYGVNPGSDFGGWGNPYHHWLGFTEVDLNAIPKAGDWLLYFDEKRDEITIHVGETITLRPYDEWKWKESNIQSKYWNVDPTKDWTINGSEGSNAPSEKWTPEGSPIEFTRYVKYDDQLEVRYWSLQGQAKETGVFYLTNTANGHVIKVNVVDGDPEPIPGTITNTAAIKVNLFDYDLKAYLDPEANNNQANNHKNQAINYNNKPFWFLSSGGANMGQPDSSQINKYTQDAANTGLVNNELNTSGYPQLVLHNGDSGNLMYLFDTNQTSWTGGENNDGMIAYPNVEGLFQKDDKGYYYFNSNVNYAYYDPTDNNKTITLYEHTYTQNSSKEKNSRVNTKPIGFFPFHEYDSINNLWVNQNSALNHHLGMSMSVDFMLPSNRLDEYGKPIMFEFSGDDDLWVFAEWTDENGEKHSKLLLDLGGIHQPITGSINFTDNSTGLETDQLYTLKVFYLERGGCDSNCSIRFNLPITKQLTVAKNVNGLTPTEREKYLNDSFKYEIGIKTDSEGLDMDQTDESFWEDPSWRTGFDLYNTKVNNDTDANKNFTVYHSRGGDIKGYPVADGQITLLDGESFTINRLPATDIFYLAEEDQLDMQQFETPHAERTYVGKDGSTVCEEEVTLHEDHSAANAAVSDWETRPYALQDTENLVYTNTIQEKNLDVEKIWADGKKNHEPIQFRLLATVEGEHYGAATGHQTINAQWTETKNDGTTTKTEDVYVYDATNGSSKLFTLNEANGWHISFEHLPKKTESANDTGKEIIYSVQEVVPDDYTVTYNGSEDTGLVYLDLYKFWPDGNENHNGTDGKPAEHITTYIKNDAGQYMVAHRDTNGEYVYDRMTEDIEEATQFELMAKSKLPAGFKTNDQYNMFDYASRVNNVPDDSYYWDEEVDEDEATSGLVMFKRPKQEIEILNKKALINVEKEWLDADDQPLENHPDQITYTVYQLKHEHEWAKYDDATQKWDYTQKAAGEGWYYIETENVDMRVCRFSSCGHYTETKPHYVDPCQDDEHEWGEAEITKEPTCTLPGSRTLTCTICGTTKTEEIPANGHSFDEGEVTTPATCSATGVKTYTCTVCGSKMTETIPKTEHTWGDWHADPNNSLREIRECSVCHETESRLKENARTIPGTTIQLEEGVWPSGDHNDNEQITINPGAFEYNGNYYVVFNSKTDTWQNFKDGPEPVLGWYFVARIDPNLGVKHPNDLPLSNLDDGQLFQAADGKYYVWINAYWGGPSSDPTNESGNWILLPESGSSNGTNGLNNAVTMGRNSTLMAPRMVARNLARMLNAGNDPAASEGSEVRGAGSGRGPVTYTDLTLSQLLTDLDLQGLGQKNDQGDTLVKYNGPRTLETTDDTLVENEANLWRDTLDVPFTDENGYPYLYYIVEDTPAPYGDYDISYSGQANGLEDQGTTRITNKLKPTGDLVVEKKVSGTSDKTKGFTFQIGLTLPTGVAAFKSSYPAVKTDADGTETETTVSVSNNMITVILKADEKIRIKELPAGTAYTVTETTLPSGYIESLHSGNTGTVSKDTDATATMNNIYVAAGTVDLSAQKVFTNGDLSLKPFTFKLTQVTGDGSVTQADGSNVTVPVKLAATESQTTNVGSDAADKTRDRVYFNQITFTKTTGDIDDSGEYWFLLEEDVPADAENADGVKYSQATDAQKAAGGFIKDGVRYDSNRKWIKVTVADDGQGNMTVTKDPDVTAGDPDDTWTNEQLGKLDVTKEVASADPNDNGFPSDGSYTYNVTITTEIGGVPYYVQNANGELGTSAPEPSLTVSNTTTLVINNLPYGSYTVTETSPGSDVTISEYSYEVVENVSHPVGSATISTETQEPIVALKNIYIRGAAWTPEVIKLVNGRDYKGTEFTFTLRQTGQGASYTDTASTNGETGEAIFSTIEYKQSELPPPGSGPWTFYYEITENRPEGAQNSPYIADNIQYDAKTIYAKVVVTKDHGKLTAVGKYYSDSQCQDELTNGVIFDNTELGSLSVTKTVTGEYPATNNDSFPFTVKKGEKYVAATISGDTYTYSGLIDTDPGYTIKADQTITFVNLPAGEYLVTEGQVSQEGYIIQTSYTVNDESASDGTVEVLKDETSSVEITNNYSLYRAELEIVKVDATNMTTPLKGATFTITPVSETGQIAVETDPAVTGTTSGANGTETGEDGKVTFSNLTNGYYVIKETETPDGFIKTDEGYFYIKVHDGVVTLVEKDGEGWKERPDNDKLIFTAASGTEPATIKFGNEPGAALPHTGGIGTTIFYVLGTMLILGCGIYLISRRRIRN